MRKSLASSLFSCLLFNYGETVPTQNSNPSIDTIEKTSTFSIIIHGGAGTILKKNMTPKRLM